jgi:hypothetical protein
MDELAEFGPKPLKIQWFQAGIECDLFTPVRAAILTDRQRFSTFDSVKDAYVDFARQQIKHANSSRDRRSVSSVNGRGGGQSSTRQGRGRPRGPRGRNNQSDREAGIPTQIEVDKCTHIQKKKYPWHEYKNFTATEKQKVYQLQYPDAKPGATGPSHAHRGRGGSSTVSAMTGSTETNTSKKRKTKEGDDDDDAHDDDGDQDTKSANRANVRQRN